MTYVTQCRIASAKYLLANADSFSLSIQKISMLVGFSSASYFTRVFTKQTGVSPTAFRERRHGRAPLPKDDAGNGTAGSLYERKFVCPHEVTRSR
jgi:two-component system response regulator YesN